MNNYKLSINELKHYQQEFLKWGKMKWPNGIFADQVIEDAFMEAITRYLKNMEDGKLPHKHIAWDYVFKMGHLELIREYRSLKKELAFREGYLKSRLNREEDEPKSDYLGSIAKKAFERLSEKEKDLLSAIIIHHFKYAELTQEEYEMQQASRDIHKKATIAKPNALVAQKNAVKRKEKERAKNKLRKIFYEILEKDREDSSPG